MFNTDFLKQFKTEPLGGGLSLVKHLVTGDAMVYGVAVGIAADQADIWKRNYCLPVVTSINTRFLPQEGGQIDIRKVDINDYHDVRLVSYIKDENFEAVVAMVHGRDIQFSENYLKLSPGNSMLLARYTGPRIEESNGMMPEGGRMDFFLVRLLLEHTPLPVDNN